MGETGGDAMRGRVLIFLLTLVLTTPSLFAVEGNGGYANAFLQVPIGARPTSLGGAYIAVSDDAAGVLFNPAGHNSLVRPLLGLSYRAMQLDRKLGYVTGLIPVKNNSTIGLHYLYAGYGSVEARDGDGYLVGHEISMNNHQFSVTFAKRFEDYISAGVNVSYIHSAYTEIKGNTIGFDFGAMLYVDELVSREKRDQMPVQAITMGLVVRNITKTLRWNSELYTFKYSTDGLGAEQTDEFPIEVGVGGSARFFKRALLLSVDAVKNTKQEFSPRFGAEYQLIKELALRAGYGQDRLAAGAGFLFSIGARTLAVDYAFSPERVDEGSEHIFSFDFLF